MLTFLDIAPPEAVAKDVTIRGVTLKLRGVGASDWARLYTRFPELQRHVMGRGGAGEDDPLRMLQAQSALIAAGTGHLGNAEVERAAMTRLSADEQRDLVAEILRMSHPGDVAGPLLDAAAAAGGGPPPAATTAT